MSTDAKHTFFSVVRIRDGKIVYQGNSDMAAARRLAPGAVHGQGDTMETSLYVADLARKNILQPA